MKRYGEPAGFSEGRVRVEEEERAFRVYRPESMEVARPAPLLVSFHGWGDGAKLMSMYTRFHKIADQEGFLLVFPEGKVRKGKVGWATRRHASSDLAFFDELMGELASTYNLDSTRTYAMGMSNGAYFVHLLAAQRSKRVTAIAAHSGGLGVLESTGISAERKLPVMIVHGDQDPVVPVAEGRSARDRYEAEGHEVEYVEISDWAHMWAIKKGVNEKIWEFFRGKATS